WRRLERRLHPVIASALAPAKPKQPCKPPTARSAGSQASTPLSFRPIGDSQGQKLAQRNQLLIAAPAHLANHPPEQPAQRAQSDGERAPLRSRRGVGVRQHPRPSRPNPTCTHRRGCSCPSEDRARGEGATWSIQLTPASTIQRGSLSPRER